MKLSLLGILFCLVGIVVRAHAEPPIEFLYESTFFSEDGERFGEPLLVGDGYTVYKARTRFVNSKLVAPKSCLDGDQNSGIRVSVVLNRENSALSRKEAQALSKTIYAQLENRCPEQWYAAEFDYYFSDLMVDRNGHLLTKDRHERKRIDDAPVARAVLYNRRNWQLYPARQQVGGFMSLQQMISIGENNRMFNATYAEAEQNRSIEATKDEWETVQAYKASLPRYLEIDGIMFKRAKTGGSNLYVHKLASGSDGVSGREMYDFVERYHAEYPILIGYWNRGAAWRTDDYSHCDGLNGWMELTSFGIAAFERPVLMFDTNGRSYPEQNEYRQSALAISQSAFDPDARNLDRGFGGGNFHAGLSSFYVGYGPDGKRHTISFWGENDTLPKSLAQSLYENSRYAKDLVERNQGVFSDGALTYERTPAIDAFPEYELLRFYHSLLLFYADWGLSGRPSEDVILPSRQGDDHPNLYERQMDSLAYSKTNCQGKREGTISEARMTELAAAQKAREEEVWRRFMSRFEGPACQTDTVLEVYGMADPCW